MVSSLHFFGNVFSVAKIQHNAWRKLRGTNLAREKNMGHLLEGRWFVTSNKKLILDSCVGLLAP